MNRRWLVRMCARTSVRMCMPTYRIVSRLPPPTIVCAFIRTCVRQCLQAVCDGRSTGPWTRKAPIKQSGGGGRATGGNTGRETNELVAVRVAIGWPSGVAGGARRQPAAYVRTWASLIAIEWRTVPATSRPSADCHRTPREHHPPAISRLPLLSLSLCLCLACLSTTRRVRPSNCRCPSPPFFSDSFRACTSASTPLRATSSTRSPDEQRPCQTLRILNFGCLGGPGSPGNHSGGPPRLPKSKISHPFKTNPTLPYVRNPTTAGSLAGMCWCHAWP